MPSSDLAPSSKFTLERQRGLLVLAVLGSYLLVFLLSGGAPYSDSGFWLFRNAGSGDIVEFQTNAYFPWAFEPLLQSFFLKFTRGYDLFMGALLLLCCLGTLELIQWIRKEENGDERPCLLFALLPLTLLFFWGVDTVLFSSLALFPWLLRDILFLLSGYSPSRKVYFRFILLSIANSVFCAQLGFADALLLLMLGLCIQGGEKSREVKFITLTLLIPALSRLFITPAPNLPVLPEAGHFVSSWGLVEHYRPLVGSDPNVLAYDWGKARHVYGLWSLVALILSVLTFVRARRAEIHSSLFQTLALQKAILLLALFVLLDTEVVSPLWAKIMPISSFARLVPEYVHLPLLRIAFGYLIYLILLSELLQSFRIRDRLSSILLSLTTVLALLFSIEHQRSQKPTKTFLRERAGDEDFAEKLFSPSYAVFLNYGFQRVVPVLQQTLPDQYHSIKPSDGTLFAKFHPELAAKAMDGNPRTRWSSGGGKQSGKEIFGLEFLPGQERKLSLLRLDLGYFPSDFPRGLRTEISDAQGNVCEVTEENPWEGPVLVTESGYPYFGPQQEILLRFPGQCLAKKVTIQQMARENHFEWSVAELQLPGPP